MTDTSISWCEGVTLVRHLTKLWEACDAKANQRSCGVLSAVEFAEKINLAAQTQKYWSQLAWMSAEVTADLVLSQCGTKIANSVRYHHPLAVGVQQSGPSASAACGDGRFRHGERHDESRGAGRARAVPSFPARSGHLVRLRRTHDSSQGSSV